MHSLRKYTPAIKAGKDFTARFSFPSTRSREAFFPAAAARPESRERPRKYGREKKLYSQDSLTRARAAAAAVLYSSRSYIAPLTSKTWRVRSRSGFLICRSPLTCSRSEKRAHKVGWPCATLSRNSHPRLFIPVLIRHRKDLPCRGGGLRGHSASGFRLHAADFPRWAAAYTCWISCVHVCARKSASRRKCMHCAVLHAEPTFFCSLSPSLNSFIISLRNETMRPRARAAAAYRVYRRIRIH